MSVQVEGMGSVPDLERELREGRDVTVTVPGNRSSAAISVLSSPLDGSGSNSNVDLLEETERLLARMNNLSKQNTDDLNRMNQASVDTLHAGHAQQPTNSLLNVSQETEDSTELNEMLEKAGHLSCIMQSISEGASMAGDSERPIPSPMPEPDDNSISQSIQKMLQSPDAPPRVTQLTPTTVDEDSNYAKQQHHKGQDPPGSVATAAKENSTQESKPQPSPDSSVLKRPTSAVHLNLGAYDDDVSSVGSASFRPYHKQTELQMQSKHQQQLTGIFDTTYSDNDNDNEKVEQENNNTVKNNRNPTGDILLGNLSGPPRLPPPDVGPTEELPPLPPPPPLPPVCSTIPPTDLRITDSSSPRDAQEGTVNWEKVTTALPGEDDYVPLVDYSNVKPSSQNALLSNTSSRVERHRQRNQKARRRQRKQMAMATPIALALLAMAFHYYVHHYKPAQQAAKAVVEEVPAVVEEPEVFWQSYDTARLLGEGVAKVDGYSFEGEDPSLVVTFLPPPVLVEEETEEEEKPKRRGFFGRRKK